MLTHVDPGQSPHPASNRTVTGSKFLAISKRIKPHGAAIKTQRHPEIMTYHDHDLECYYCCSFVVWQSYHFHHYHLGRRLMRMSQETSRWSIPAERTCDLRVVAAWRNSGIGRFASRGLKPLKPLFSSLMPGICCDAMMIWTYMNSNKKVWWVPVIR